MSIPRAILPMVVIVAAACGGSHSDDGRAATPGQASQPAEATSGADSARKTEIIGITTTDGSMRLSLLDDRVSLGLSDSLLAKVRHDMDSSTSKKEGGLAGSFAHMITSKVSNALGTKVERPLSEIDDVNYENGEIHFISHGNKPFIGFDNVKTGKDSKPVMQQFAPADAQRFAAAARARLGKK